MPSDETPTDTGDAQAGKAADSPPPESDTMPPPWRARLIASRTRLDDNRLESLKIKVDLFREQLAVFLRQMEAIERTILMQIEAVEKQTESMNTP